MPASTIESPTTVSAKCSPRATSSAGTSTVSLLSWIASIGCPAAIRP
jgi:hypothetical protein